MHDQLTFSSGPVPKTARWHARSGQYIVKPFEDNFFVYAAVSGETHILNFIAYDLLHQLEQGHYAVDDLVDVMRSFYDVDAQDYSETLLFNTLESLDAAGLIECEVSGA